MVWSSPKTPNYRQWSFFLHPNTVGNFYQKRPNLMDMQIRFDRRPMDRQSNSKIRMPSTPMWILRAVPVFLAEPVVTNQTGSHGRGWLIICQLLLAGVGFVARTDPTTSILWFPLHFPIIPTLLLHLPRIDQQHWPSNDPRLTQRRTVLHLKYVILFFFHLHDHWVGLDDHMVDVAPSPGLDSPALGPNRDPQGHLRSPVSKLKASLWVPGGVDSTAECLKFEKIQNVCSFLNFCQWQKSVWTVDALSLSLLQLPRGEIGPELWNQNSKRCSAAADTFGKIGNKILFQFSFLLPYWLQISRNIPKYPLLTKIQFDKSKSIYLRHLPITLWMHWHWPEQDPVLPPIQGVANVQGMWYAVPKCDECRRAGVSRGVWTELYPPGLSTVTSGLDMPAWYFAIHQPEPYIIQSLPKTTLFS